MVLYDGFSNVRKKQNTPKPPMHTLKNRSLKSHVDALEQQVNHNGLRLEFRNFRPANNSNGVLALWKFVRLAK